MRVDVHNHDQHASNQVLLPGGSAYPRMASDSQSESGRVLLPLQFKSVPWPRGMLKFGLQEDPVQEEQPTATEEPSNSAVVEPEIPSTSDPERSAAGGNQTETGDPSPTPSSSKDSNTSSKSSSSTVDLVVPARRA